MSRRVALIAGAGGVLGAALAQEFADAGYAVCALTRRSGSMPAGAGHRSVVCDLADAAATERAIADAVVDRGAVDVLVYNAAHLRIAAFAETTHDDFETAWRVGVAGAAASARAVLPGMLKRGSGTLIFTGATASVRGAARFGAFAAAKFALRGMAQSLAREVQPQGVHVVHVILDGLLRGSPSVARFGGDDAKAIDPRDVAKTYLWLAEQPRSAWTHEIDLRPEAERF